MISVNDLVEGRVSSGPPVLAGLDPLQEVDVLQEAQLLCSRVEQLTSSASFLFELRTSLQFETGNAALLVIRGLRSFGWASPGVHEPLSALTVVSSFPHCSEDDFRASFAFFPPAQLEVSGKLAEFYILEVDGISDVPPDYSDVDQKCIQQDLPSWSSMCSVLQVSNSC